ncbi:hypothetical protein BLOT_007813 [Blomia tropicalis]|nr:hypothetical protein BLOT_007813 [Blomia tropicalis]
MWWWLAGFKQINKHRKFLIEAKFCSSQLQNGSNQKCNFELFFNPIKIMMTTIAKMMSCFSEEDEDGKKDATTKSHFTTCNLYG